MKPLLPERHPDQDFFIADFGDVIPKSDIASMEHPLFTLSTKPDTRIREYEHNENTVIIAPSAYGLATIRDKDILIYCISQLMKTINENIDKAKTSGKDEYEAPPRKVRFKAYDLLVTTNRGTGGREYKLLKQALERLAGTRIQTNIRTDEKEITEGFGIIDSYRIVTEDKKTKRMVELEVNLSEWLYNSILGQEVLSINRNYFRLRKPLERRVYEIARKHCGNKRQWKIGLENLLKKTGSSSSKPEFKRMLNYIVKYNHLPDYRILIEGNNVFFYNKAPHKKAISNHSNRPFLRPDTLENAKKIIRHLGLDVYALEAEWLEFWKDSGEPELKTPDGAFINFCKRKTS